MLCSIWLSIIHIQVLCSWYLWKFSSRLYVAALFNPSFLILLLLIFVCWYIYFLLAQAYFKSVSQIMEWQECATMLCIYFVFIWQIMCIFMSHKVCIKKLLSQVNISYHFGWFESYSGHFWNIYYINCSQYVLQWTSKF